MNVKEIAENILKQLPEKLEFISIKHLWDNKPLMKLILTEKILRIENNYCFNYFYTLLHAVARFGKDELMKNFVYLESLIDYRDDFKRTPLWYAAAYNKVKTMELMLRHGARVRLKDDRGWTALHIAAINGHYNICEILLHYGANPSEPDNFGFTPLHKAIWSKHIKIVILFLIISPKSVNTFSFYSGIYPLHLATIKNNLVICNLLLKNGANINCQTVNGITPLILASQLSLKELCIFFIKMNADLRICTKSGWTAIHMASFYGSITCVEYLLKYVKGNITNVYNGWTSLHVAAWQGHLEIVQRLLKKKNDILLLPSLSGFTSIDLAAQNGHSNILIYLLESCPLEYKGPAIHLASISGQKHCVLALINLANTNINETWAPYVEGCSNVKYSAVQYAVFAGQREIVCLLLKHGAKIIDVLKAYLRVWIKRNNYIWLKKLFKFFNLSLFY